MACREVCWKSETKLDMTQGHSPAFFCGIGYCANLRSLRLTPFPSARRRGTVKGRKAITCNAFFVMYLHSNTFEVIQNKESRTIYIVRLFYLWVEDGIRTHDKKSSYPTHYQQVATATFKHLQIGLQIRTQLFVV